MPEKIFSNTRSASPSDDPVLPSSWSHSTGGRWAIQLLLSTTAVPYSMFTLILGSCSAVSAAQTSSKSASRTEAPVFPVCGRPPV